MADVAEIIKKLEYRNEHIACALAESRVVDDVLDRCILSRRAGSDKHNENYSAEEVYSAAAGGALHYLPKGRMEPLDEYNQRISMTPFFPECPSIMNDRQGALFSSPPEIEGDEREKYEEFARNCNGAQQPVLEAIARTARLIPRNGLCAVLVDRKPMDAETAQKRDAGQLSEAEAAALGFNLPRLAIYAAHDILDLEFDATGLAWIKLRECSKRRAGWDSPILDVTTIRIIDRTKIISREIIREPGKEPTVTDLPDVVHKMVDAEKHAICPVAIGTSPIEMAKGIGRSMMIESAQADVAATRILSDIMWSLFVLGQPILTYLTQSTDPEDLKKFATGASRYVPLKAGTAGRSDEKLAYCVLDSVGIDLLVEMRAQMQQTARNAAGKGADQAEIAPTAESGISRAWKFKTGEERTLFLLTNQLQALWDHVFDMVAVVMDFDPEKVSIRFNTKFDVGGDAKTAETLGKVLQEAKSSNLLELARVTMHRLVNTLGTLSEEEEKKIRAEIDKMQFAVAEAADDTGKIPLTLQQLALAAERADKQGNKKLANSMRSKMDELSSRLSAGSGAEAEGGA